MITRSTMPGIECGFLGNRCSPLDRPVVLTDQFVGRSRGSNLPVLQQHAGLADCSDLGKFMGDKETGLSIPADLLDIFHAFMRERLITDRKHLVHEENIMICLDGDGKPGPDLHPRAEVVGLYILEPP
jgi:hypothetical protein